MVKMLPEDLFIQKNFLRTCHENHNILVKSLNKTENYMKESIEILQKWCAEQPHFPPNAFSDNNLRRNLQLNKFNIEKTKEKLDNILTARGKFLDIFGDRDPRGNTIREGMTMMDIICYPQLTPDNERVSHTRILELDPSKFDPVKSYAYCYLTADMRISVDTNYGEVYICDCLGMTLQHFLKFTPPLVKKLMFIMQNCYGAQLKSVHFLNCPSYGEVLINIIKSLMKKKLSDRVYVHHNVEDVYKYIPRSIFPKDYGGDEPMTFRGISDQWKNYICESEVWREWFIKSSTITTDESKRPKKHESVWDEMIGLSGTFRKLDLD